jgi:hypothetical protein
MAPAELAQTIEAAIERTIAEKNDVFIQDLQIEVDGRPAVFDLRVRELIDPPSLRGFVISFSRHRSH